MSHLGVASGCPPGAISPSLPLPCFSHRPEGPLGRERDPSPARLVGRGWIAPWADVDKGKETETVRLTSQIPGLPGGGSQEPGLVGAACPFRPSGSAPRDSSPLGGTPAQLSSHPPSSSHLKEVQPSPSSLTKATSAAAKETDAATLMNCVYSYSHTNCWLRFNQRRRQLTIMICK